MNAADFEADRAYFSHDVLRNGMLNGLSSPPDLWSDARLTIGERATALTGNWPETLAKTRLVLVARRTWTEPIAHYSDAPALLRALVRNAQRLPGQKPGGAFPSSATIERWLADIGEVVAKLGSGGAEWGAEEVERFWVSLLSLSDFITALQRPDPRYWNYFKDA